MTGNEFANALRILRSIDEYELAPFGWPADRRAAFLRDPEDFFRNADGSTADQLWQIITARQPVTRKLEVVK
jgi:hypothetical protein